MSARRHAGAAGSAGPTGYPPGFRDIYSGSLSVPRDVILGVGGFDETFKQSQTGVL